VMDNSTKRLLVVGPTGSGKSQLIDKYTTGAHPIIGQTMQSESTETVAYPTNIGGEVCTTYDTPGMGDSQQRDQSFLNNMVETLQHSCSGIHKVYFFMTVTEARLNDYLQVCLDLILQLAPDLKQKSSILTIVLNKADQGAETYWNNPPVVNKVAEIKEWVRQTHSIDVSVITIGTNNQQAFIDSVRSASKDVYCQTAFMKNVQTLDTQRAEAYAQLEQAKRENAQDKDKLDQLKKEYDASQNAVNEIRREMTESLKKMAEDFAKRKPEVIVVKSGGGANLFGQLCQVALLALKPFL